MSMMNSDTFRAGVQGTPWLLRSGRSAFLAALAASLTFLPNTASAQLGERDQILHQNVPGFQDSNETGDKFGNAVATGDFDCDGFADIAIGVSSEDTSGVANSGAVHVIYGSANGPDTVRGVQRWIQGLGAVHGLVEENDWFGSDVVTGDFDGNGCDDLVIAVSGEDVGEVVDAGAVHVLYGREAPGLLSTDSQLWHQDSPGILDAAEQSDHFGSSLASGDFNDDGYDDLAVGADHESIGDEIFAGAVHVLYGSVEGLSTTGNQLWHQDSPGLAGVVEGGDYFGESLAAGNFDGDDYDDLAIGANGEDLGSTSNTGAVQVLYGGSAGLSDLGNALFDQDNLRFPGHAEAGDSFGNALAVGDFDNDGFDDLAVGAEGEDTESLSRTNTGTVWVVDGGEFGLSPLSGLTIWDQGNLAGTLESGDLFGNALAAGDFDGDGIDDLSVGIQGEDLGTILGTGAVQVVYGSQSGLTPIGNQLLDQESPGIQGTAEAGDNFGFSLAAGDFDNDGADDLATGVVGEDLSGVDDTGVVQVIFGSALIFADGFESGDTCAWSAASGGGSCP